MIYSVYWPSFGLKEQIWRNFKTVITNDLNNLMGKKVIYKRMSDLLRDKYD